MSSARCLGPEPTRVVAIEVNSDAYGLDREGWVIALDGGNPVKLPRPAAEYLREARSAGGV